MYAIRSYYDKLAGIKTTYIPFKGTGASVTALLGKQVKAQWGYTPVAAKYERTRLLAVAMEKRHPRFPDVPTFKELGFDFVSGAYRGIAVPSSTPEDIRKKLSKIIDEINNDPEFINVITSYSIHYTKLYDCVSKKYIPHTSPVCPSLP